MKSNWYANAMLTLIVLLLGYLAFGRDTASIRPLGEVRIANDRLVVEVARMPEITRIAGEVTVRNRLDVQLTSLDTNRFPNGLPVEAAEVPIRINAKDLGGPLPVQVFGPVDVSGSTVQGEWTQTGPLPVVFEVGAGLPVRVVNGVDIRIAGILPNLLLPVVVNR